ncbi:MAG: multicopper oxidase domain-containing protein [Acidobacteriia bacterium]|nr:multicopper oxidase domain-containing protein [Terriglobia bacterium]MBZ5722905.1 multicopper oxidase domain-containing protein [Terriglobia bacterium]
MIHRLLTAVLVPFIALGAVANEGSANTVPIAQANDNRVVGGQLERGLFTIQLELLQATWYPEQDGGPSFPVYVFAEPGKAPQIPGPLIRVPQGTEVHASIHNSLPVTMYLRGLHSHEAASSEPLRIAAGQTAEVRFSATTVGTYYYSARSMKESLREVGSLTITDDLPMGEGPFGIESQLVGGFIVDPPGSVPDDRVFIITLWMGGIITPPFRETPAINGKSWPYTERLSLKVGDTAHWRILNPSMSDHAMHLHGFFFQVNSLGDGEHDRLYAPDETPHAVTQYLIPGGTTSLTWKPDRAGNWILHCHMIAHMLSQESLTSHPPEQASEHAAHDADSAGMGGLVLGINVSPAGERLPLTSSTAPTRHLRLLVRERPASRFSPLGMGYLIQEGDAKETSDPPPIPGAPLVLTRGETAEIQVVNQLHEVTAVHWHGIELESYYDGVPGWGGEAPQITPPIPPGGTFLARMTPPRAGTFIYHTHWHDVGQLTSGLYGPIIVVEPGQKFDPDVDKVFLIGRAGPDESVHPMVLNGSPQPGPLVLKAGTRYRFRFINIGTNDSDTKISLLADSKPVSWRALAKDGWTLPDAQATLRPAQQSITVGETYDFEFASEHPDKLVLEVTGPFLGVKLSQLITVR